MNKKNVYRVGTLILIIIGFIVVNIIILKRNEKIYGDYEGPNEFLQTVDCASIFADQTADSFLISFDLRVKTPGTVKMYQFNSISARYYFEPVYFDATTEFKHYEYVVHPSVIDLSETQSYLSFHGTYGTGVIPVVKNVTIEKQK